MIQVLEVVLPAVHTILADGMGTLLQYGGANADWVEASGGTYNSVEKIDSVANVYVVGDGIISYPRPSKVANGNVLATHLNAIGSNIAAS